MQLGSAATKNLKKPLPQQFWEGVARGRYTLINTIPAWETFLEQLKSKTCVAGDTETTGLNHLDSHIVGFSFSWGAEHSYYIPIRHTRLIRDPSVPTKDWNPKKPQYLSVPTDEKQLDEDLVIEGLREVFANPDLTTVWHNAKFDIHFLRNEKIELEGVIHDTMLLHALLDENSRHTLKSLATNFIDSNADKWEKMVDEWRSKFARTHKRPKATIHYGYLPLNIAVPYAASDTHYTWALYKRFLPMVAADPHLRVLYTQVEAKLLRVILHMEQWGACIDRNFLLQESPKMGEKMEELEKKIKSELNHPTVNVNSVQQIIPILQKKGVRLGKKSKKTGKPSLDREVLQKLAPRHPVCQYLLEYRDLKKQKSTYVDSLAEKAKIDDKVHCTYNQNVATGRMSGSSPNLMNIPGNSDTTRSAFVPPIRHACSCCGWTDDRVVKLVKCPKCSFNELEIDDDYFMLFVDYSQVEIRLTGHYSQDPILLEIYNKTFEDVHTRTMCELFGKYSYDEAVKILSSKNHPLHKEVSQERKVAKMVNFLIIYGGGPYNLAAQISTPEHVYTPEQCEIFINTYFKKFRGVKSWIDRAKKQVMEDRQLQNHFGRYRRLPELKDANRRMMMKSERWKIERALRQGVNYLIQGTCADLFKIALVRVYELLKDTKSRIVMPIHDEIVMYMHRQDIKILPNIVESMEDFDFRVPILASLAWSKTNWNEKQELILS